MSDNRMLDVLKGAILLEERGKALYESVFQTTRIAAVKELFEFLAREEVKHIELLRTQFVRQKNDRPVDIGSPAPDSSSPADHVVSEKIIGQISAAGYEAAVISAALELEKKAVNYYAEQAEAAASRPEKQLFEWLSEWEKSHMQMLARIDGDLREKVWFDNRFWPLD